MRISAWVAKQLLSYRAFETQCWRLIASQLPIGLGEMTISNPCKHMVELYETLKQRIVEEINLAKQQFHILFMSLNLDLYHNMFNNMKFPVLYLNWLRWSSSNSHNLAFIDMLQRSKNAIVIKHQITCLVGLESFCMNLISSSMCMCWPIILIMAPMSNDSLKLSWCLCMSGVYPTYITSPSSMFSAFTSIQPSARTRMYEMSLLMSTRWWRRSISRRHRRTLSSSHQGRVRLFYQAKDCASLLNFTPWLFLSRDSNNSVVHENIRGYWCLYYDVPFVANMFQPDVPLLICDPIPFGTPCHPKEERILTMINSKTYHVRKLLRQALCTRFYDGYHPINALKYSNLFYHARMINGEAIGYLNCSSFYVDDFKFS